MNTKSKSKRSAVLVLLLLATVGTLVAVSAAADARPAVLLYQLAGPWQIAVVGNTGCGISSLRLLAP